MKSNTGEKSNVEMMICIILVIKKSIRIEITILLRLKITLIGKKYNNIDAEKIENIGEVAATKNYFVISVVKYITFY